MPKDRPGLGEQIAERLLARGGNGLHRRGMADGGEVFTGALVDRAMKALGGKVNAFTMNQRVFMPSTFDATNPADQATYAHEQIHARSGDDSGGRRFGANPDAEEAHARSVEEMVLHRAQAGESMGQILGQGPVLPGSGGSSAPASGDLPDPMVAKDAVARGYTAMLAEGLSHREIVDLLKQHVVDAMATRREDRRYRGASSETP